MDRQPPRITSNAIDLYVRTYYSLLRSSGDVRVRAFEEAHVFSDSSLHAGARDERPDVAAFAYAAARLPGCMPQVSKLVVGQSVEQFVAAGFPVGQWQPAVARGRRRPTRWDGGSTVAMFITSASDIDDLVPISTAYQIEWNKLHRELQGRDLGTPGDVEQLQVRVREVLELSEHEMQLLAAALGRDLVGALAAIVERPIDLSFRLLAGSLLEYRRATERWWQGIAAHYLAMGNPLRPRPVYFVSSNTHALCNLLGGYAREHRDSILAYARREDPEGLAGAVDEAQRKGDDTELLELGYYLLRRYIRADPAQENARRAAVQRFDGESGITTVQAPGRLDVPAQLFDLRRLRAERLDERLVVDGIDALVQSDAVIVNIDYPLGMAAYHHLTQLAQGVGEIRGVYVMGKAATLNGRVGDVMLSTVAYDEHSENTYLFRNCFAAADIQPWVSSTVLDNQKALTVRGPFLQNRAYMNLFYREGYTVLEMESGPYLSAVYEMVFPKRHPTDEIVHLSNVVPFEFGLLHYASDTPYSRRQTLLSKSLSYFGIDSTYGCAIAILRRIFEQEIHRIGRE